MSKAISNLKKNFSLIWGKLNSKKFQRYTWSFVILVVALIISLITDISAFEANIDEFGRISAFSMAGRIIGLILYILVGQVFLYELFKSYKISKFSQLILLVGMIVSILSPFDEFIITRAFTRDINSNLDFISSFYNWTFFVIVTLLLMLLFISESIFGKTKIISLEYFKLFFYLMIIIIGIKSIWFFNVISWVYSFVFLLPISFLTDSFSYLGGSIFGKYKNLNNYKLAPKISPSKTWVGFGSGYIVGIIYTGVVGYYVGAWGLTGNQNVGIGGLSTQAWAAIMAFFLPLFSVLGDLFFSYYKRSRNIKDFSSIIPGHGGFLDRFDSTLTLLTLLTLILLVV